MTVRDLPLIIGLNFLSWLLSGGRDEGRPARSASPQWLPRSQTPSSGSELRSPPPQNANGNPLPTKHNHWDVRIAFFFSLPLTGFCLAEEMGVLRPASRPSQRLINSQTPFSDSDRSPLPKIQTETPSQPNTITGCWLGFSFFFLFVFYLASVRRRRWGSSCPRRVHLRD